MLTHTLVVLTSFAGSQQPAYDPLGDLSGGRTLAKVNRLASFGTRHTQSETESDERGIGAARRWILSEFESYGGRLEPRLERFDVPAGPRLPGARRS
jgi:hypothetical protein